MRGVFPSLSFTFTSAPASMRSEATFWLPVIAETLMSGVHPEPVSTTSTCVAKGTPASVRPLPCGTVGQTHRGCALSQAPWFPGPGVSQLNSCLCSGRECAESHRGSPCAETAQELPTGILFTVKMETRQARKAPNCTSHWALMLSFAVVNYFKNLVLFSMFEHFACTLVHRVPTVAMEARRGHLNPWS